MDIDNAEFMEEFMEDMIKHLKIMNDVLTKFRKGKLENLQELLNEMFRAAHSIKGMAAAMEFSLMEKLTHKMEDLLYEMRDGRVELNEIIIELLGNGYDYLSNMLESIEASGVEDGAGLENMEELMENLMMASGKKEVKMEIDIEKIVNSEKESCDEYFEKIEKYISKGKKVFGAKYVIDSNCPFKAVRALIFTKEMSENSEFIFSIPSKAGIESGCEQVDDGKVCVFVSAENELVVEKIVKKQSDLLKYMVSEIRDKSDIEKLACGEIAEKCSNEELKIEVSAEEYTSEILKEIDEKLLDIEGDILKLDIYEENLTIVNAIEDKFQAIEELIEMTNLEKMKVMSLKAKNIIMKISGKTLSAETETIDIILDTLLFLKKICKDSKILQNKIFLKKFEEHIKNADILLQKNVNSEAENKAMEKLLKDKLNLKDKEIEKLVELQKERYSGMKLGEIAVRENMATTKDVISALKSKKDIPKSAGQEVVKQNAEAGEHENIRIPSFKADHLIDMLEELLVVESQLSMEAGKHFSNDSGFIQQINTMSRIIKDIQNLSISFRMVSLKTVFQKVKISFKDTIKKLDKKVELTIRGEECEIDRIIASKLVDPMLHLIKNSISHGIESEEIRVKRGKTPIGRVMVEAYSDKGYVYIVIADDGNGIDIKRVFEKAKEKNLVDISKNYSEQEIINFIMLPGFSTAESVNEIAGRGVGMDVVKTELSKVGGKIEIESRPEKGSTFVLRLPKNMTSLNGTVVTIGTKKYIIPTNYIKEIFKIEEDKFVYSMGHKKKIKLRDTLINIVETKKYFECNEKSQCEKVIVVLEVDKHIIGLPVENILERREVVVKPIGEEFEKVKHIFGASILGDGKAALILNIENMVQC